MDTLSCLMKTKSLRTQHSAICSKILIVEQQRKYLRRINTTAGSEICLLREMVFMGFAVIVADKKPTKVRRNEKR